jgi:hypothetical protein
MIQLSTNKAKGFEYLTFNHAGVLLLKNGLTANYGVIRKENDSLIYFTGKGLREIWAPDISSDHARNKAFELKKIYETNGIESLIASNHIAIIPLVEIERVLF